MRRLFIDIETSPNIVFSWSTGYKTFIDYQNIIRERSIICICYKWADEKAVKFLKWDGKQNDKSMVAKIISVLNEADEVIGHNIEQFDLPWIRTRAMFHGIRTNPHYKCVDTLKYSRMKMYLNSNKLDYLARYLGVGCKIKTEFALWKKIALYNDKKALAKMIKYCKMDVLLLERVYDKLAEHMAAQTHAGVMAGSDKWTCPHCGSANVHAEKTRVSALGSVKHQMQCNVDGRYYTVSDKTFRDYSEKRKADAEAARKARKRII